MPTNGSVAINVIRAGQDPQIVMPWTLITADTAKLFAEGVRALPLAPGTDSLLYPGVNLAADSINSSGTVACWRTIHVLGMTTEPDPQLLEAARDNALFPSSPRIPVNQINAIALEGAGLTRAYMLDHLAKSIGPVSIAFAAGIDSTWNTSEPWLVYDWLHLILRRETACPGDFNRDGVVDAQDLFDFDAAAGSMPPDPYADWDMDGTVDPGVDGDAFEASWDASEPNSPTPCPCP